MSDFAAIKENVRKVVDYCVEMGDSRQLEQQLQKLVPDGDLRLNRTEAADLFLSSSQIIEHGVHEFLAVGDYLRASGMMTESNVLKAIDPTQITQTVAALADPKTKYAFPSDLTPETQIYRIARAIDSVGGEANRAAFREGLQNVSDERLEQMTRTAMKTGQNEAAVLFVSEENKRAEVAAQSNGHSQGTLVAATQRAAAATQQRRPALAGPSR